MNIRRESTKIPKWSSIKYFCI